MKVESRSELLFLYDVTYGNPNGDPLDANKPRIDEETGRNIVTDVRLKRTIRDYLHEYEGEEIFIKEIADEQGNIQDAKTRAEDFLEKDGKKLDKTKLTLGDMKKIILDNILANCIDVRLFGATIPIEKSSRESSSITLTGPVQFKIGQSLHRVKLQFIKGTGAFASGTNRTQKTFREEYVLPYSLIAFYGVVNENAGIHTRLTEDDVNLLIKGMWFGTKNLISRSKFEHQPRFLLRIVYNTNNYFIGELDKLICLDLDKNDEDIRDIEEFDLNVTKLKDAIVNNKEKIERVELKADNRVKFNIDLCAELKNSGILLKEV